MGSGGDRQQNMHQLVSRQALDAAAWPNGDSPSTRALDTRLQRLRNRAAKLGLEIANVRHRGFLLTTCQD
jgi:DNA-binding response OmpR family regulator